MLEFKLSGLGFWGVGFRKSRAFFSKKMGLGIRVFGSRVSYDYPSTRIQKLNPKPLTINPCQDELRLTLPTKTGAPLQTALSK